MFNRKFTERDSIKSAINSFINKYGKKSSSSDKRGINVGEELSKLNVETCTANEVNNLIGSDWTTLTCDQCKEKVKSVVCVGEEPEYESKTAYICEDCLKKALALVKD